MCGVAAAIGQGANTGAVSVVRADARTGRLVRTTVKTRTPVSSAPSAKPPAPLAETVNRIARQNQVSPELVDSVIQVESNYNPNALSPKGAQGLMQLIPATARRFGVSDVFDPEDNVQGGARYLRYLLELYRGDEALALAAYNAGEGAVARYGGVPPYPETQSYVAKVQQRLAGAPAAETETAARAVKPTGAQAETAPAETYRPIREVRDANGKVTYISQ
ncbi:MAG: lytic transglycosylase domain-containing protein [Bryobacteraceae bacterium]